MKRNTGPLRALAFVGLVLATGATSIGCTAVSGKVSTAEMPAPAAEEVQATSGWSAFLDWGTDMTSEGTSIMDMFIEDANAYDVPAVEDDARSLYQWADSARQWLAANPPESCYASVHQSYDRAMSHYQKAGSLLMDIVSASGLTAATSELKLGNAEVGRTTGLIKSTSC